MKPTALILQARGTNRDLDVAEALTLAGADPVFAPLNELRAGKKHFSDYQMLILPGGFSYADALGAGKLLALDLNSYFEEEIAVFVAAGKPVIGICNGFQALVKSGILPGNDIRYSKVDTRNPNIEYSNTPVSNIESRDVTLTFNECGHFECRWVTLQPISQTCIWTRDLPEVITCPVSHGEGNFQTNIDFRISSLVANDQIALTYTQPDGSPANTQPDGSPANGDYPANPNGSLLDIAGICNPAGNVLGLMPHPENHIHAWQHPRHTRGESGQSGLVLFENGVKYAKNL
jgi:phosphoribosylformylglycinamidine synthase subunit PurQ / glutaminase